MLPATLRSPAERREYLVAIGLVCILQGALAVALAACALQTYRLWRQEVAYLPGEFRGVVPALLLVGAAVAALATVRTAGRIRTLKRIPLDPGPRE